MAATRGTLVLSLDFELFWGVRDKRTLEGYGPNIMGVRQAIPRMLDHFVEHGLHATWATVGFLFFDGREELLSGLPRVLPGYENRQLSPYLVLDTLGENEEADPYHFAPSLIRRIAEAPGQEIGTHTFSHYYCLEPGQDGESFRADLEAAMSVAQRKIGRRPTSLVFPRNQFNADYLGIAAEAGIRAYRGNERSWIYSAQRGDAESAARRFLRLADAYFPLTGHNAFPIGPRLPPLPSDIPASRFLRPASRRLGALEKLRLSRILAGLTHAARTGGTYHLWWHPHNFGRDLERNMLFLGAITGHFTRLAEEHGFRSRIMGEMAEEVSP